MIFILISSILFISCTALGLSFSEICAASSFTNGFLLACDRTEEGPFLNFPAVDPDLEPCLEPLLVGLFAATLKSKSCYDVSILKYT